MLIAFACFSATSAYAADCGNFFNSVQPIPANFGAAFNVFSAEKELLVKGTACEENAAKIEIGSGKTEQLIYQKGFVWSENTWQEIPLQGEGQLLIDAWYQKAAFGSVPLNSNGNAYVLGFTCEYRDQNWKCGCLDAACAESKWQLQRIQQPVNNPPTGAILEQPPVFDPEKTLVANEVCPEDAAWPTRSQMSGKDVKITLPKNRVCKARGNLGGLDGNPARHIWVVGGELDYTDGVNGSGGLTVAWWSGTALIEGIEIDMNNSCNDAIRSFRAKGNARMVIQNSYLSGAGYCTETGGTHGDAYHAQGGEPSKGDVTVNELLMQNVRADLIAQGLFVPYRVDTVHGVRKMILDHVEFYLDPRYKFSKGNISTMIYAGNYSSAYPDDLNLPDGQSYNEVYLNWWDPWYPDMTNRKDITVPSVEGYDEKGCAIFSSQKIQDYKILSGSWCKGPPPQGSFVPLDKIGRNYDRAFFTEK